MPSTCIRAHCEVRHETAPPRRRSPPVRQAREGNRRLLPCLQGPRTLLGGLRVVRLGSWSGRTPGQRQPVRETLSLLVLLLLAILDLPLETRALLHLPLLLDVQTIHWSTRLVQVDPRAPWVALVLLPSQMERWWYRLPAPSEDPHRSEIQVLAHHQGDLHPVQKARVKLAVGRTTAAVGPLLEIHGGHLQDRFQPKPVLLGSLLADVECLHRQAKHHGTAGIARRGAKVDSVLRRVAGRHLVRADTASLAVARTLPCLALVVRAGVTVPRLRAATALHVCMVQTARASVLPLALPMGSLASLVWLSVRAHHLEGPESTWAVVVSAAYPIDPGDCGCGLAIYLVKGQCGL